MLAHSASTHHRRLSAFPLSSTLSITTLVLALVLAHHLDARATHSLPSSWAGATWAESPGSRAFQPPAPPTQQPALDYHLFLPAVTSQYPERLLDIYDWYGNPQSWEWLIARFGAVWLQRGTGAAPVRILQEDASGQTVLIAAVERDGQPVPGIPVMFYWPDAPGLAPSLRACGLDRALVVVSNSAGEAHFAMGGGSAYWPPGGGPHIVWVGGPDSDCLGGLGWLGETDHIHLNSTWDLP